LKYWVAGITSLNLDIDKIDKHKELGSGQAFTGHDVLIEQRRKNQQQNYQ